MLVIAASASLISEPDVDTAKEHSDAKNPVYIEVADSFKFIINAVCNISQVSQKIFSFLLGNLTFS